MPSFAAGVAVQKSSEKVEKFKIPATPFVRSPRLFTVALETRAAMTSRANLTSEMTSRRCHPAAPRGAKADSRSLRRSSIPDSSIFSLEKNSQIPWIMGVW